jgi:transcriptional regulator with XRE-family HTH domain
MANDRLRDAMLAARLDVEQLADAVDVDPRTVERWLGGRRPYRRLRWATAAALGVDERAIWPDPQSRPTENWQADELVEIYGYRADLPTERWSALIAEATERIDLLGYALRFLFESDPRLAGLLAEKAKEGCQVRIALIDPDCAEARRRDEEEEMGGGLLANATRSLRELSALMEQPGAEVRQHASPLYNSLLRSDEQMFVTPHLWATPGYAAPLLQLARVHLDGPFDRFATHFEEVWRRSTPVARP